MCKGVKLGATWCGPCSRIQPIIDSYIKKLPKIVNCYFIDIDDNIELYSFFKNKRRINGVPALLAYYKGNASYISNETVIGANIPEIHTFFEKCILEGKKMIQ